MLHSRNFCVMILVTGGAVGCDGRGNVSGKVYYQDAPMSGGQVIFLAANQQTTSAPIGADGSYQATKVGTGLAKIAIVPEQGTSPVSSKEATMMKGMQKTVGAGTEKTGEIPTSAAKKGPPLPFKFHNPESSEVTFEVRGGDNTFDIKLK